MSSRRVLVIDDDEAVRFVVSATCEAAGHEVLQAESGYLALNLAESERIDAILLDIDMPRMNGIEVCRRIRAMPAHRVTPILFITGASHHERLAEAFSVGGDDFITKPVDTMVLLARLQGHLRRVEYFHQLQRSRQTLEQYVSRRTIEIVDAFSATGIVPVPKEQDVSICFTDIRGFTALAEEIDATTLFSLISARLTQQVKLVHQHGGYVDKFGGDGIMAVFDGDARVRQSCLCAIDIIGNAMAEVRTERIGQLGIGIHCGRAVIGNIGSTEHLDYSVIGTNVNLAARLCGHAEPMSIVVSKAVRDAVGQDPGLHFHSERQVPIRGFKNPVTVYGLSAGDAS